MRVVGTLDYYLNSNYFEFMIQLCAMKLPTITDFSYYVTKAATVSIITPIIEAALTQCPQIPYTYKMNDDIIDSSLFS